MQFGIKAIDIIKAFIAAIVSLSLFTKLIAVIAGARAAGQKVNERN